MEYGCVYSFVGRRSTTAETTAVSAAHFGVTTYMFFLIFVLVTFLRVLYKNIHHHVNQRSKLHTYSAEVPVLHTPVEVRFSMTCRFVHSVLKSFICCYSGRDSCMLTSRCMLPWLRSAPYPALCPRQPLRPVGDMQAVSYGARSRQCSQLLPASSSQPRSIVERPRSGPMGRVHIYTTIQAF